MGSKRFSFAVRFGVVCLGAGCVLAATTATVVSAETRSERRVATVGTVAITVAAVERRLAKVPLFQLRMLGKDGDTVRRAFVQQLIETELFVQGARLDKLDQEDDVRDRIRSVLVSALKLRLRKEALKAGDVSDAEIESYYKKHADRYKSQLRIQLWKIAVASKAQADKLLGIIKRDPEYQKDPVKGWEKLARAHSLDKSTRMRSGNLGFVQPDGSTAHKSVRVPQKLVQAAMKVKDGQVIPHAIQVGRQWIVLQRRASHQTPERTLQNERRTIRGLLSKQRVQARLLELRDELRKKYVKEMHAQRVDRLDVTQRGDLATKSRPGVLPRRHAPAGSPRPIGKPGRMR